jgi:hypothetical protein
VEPERPRLRMDPFLLFATKTSETTKKTKEYSDLNLERLTTKKSRIQRTHIKKSFKTNSYLLRLRW